jgi:hypothetical protein
MAAVHTEEAARPVVRTETDPSFEPADRRSSLKRREPSERQTGVRVAKVLIGAGAAAFLWYLLWMVFSLDALAIVGFLGVCSFLAVYFYFIGTAGKEV